MHDQNEDSIKLFVGPYQQRIFALVLYLVGQDQDVAYDICASSFSQALQESFRSGLEEISLNRVTAIAVEKCRNSKTIPTFDVIELLAVPDAEKGPLRMVLKALQMLDFELKVYLLLRFQINLSYCHIGDVMRTSESSARTKTIRARAQLDDEIQRILSHSQAK